MNLMERFADPELIHGLTMGEKLVGSGITALMGMGVTFVVLFFLWGCLALMARVLNRSEKSEPAATGPAGMVSPQMSQLEPTAPAPSAMSQQDANASVAPVVYQTMQASATSAYAARQQGITPQVISAMTAAVSAYENSDAPLAISRIETSPANWTYAGRMDGRKGL